MENRVLITKSGHEKMLLELKNLTEKERPKIIKAVSDARALGDLSENAEYHAAKDRQKTIESRINELEELQARSEIIDPSEIIDKSSIRFGAKVEILNLETDERKIFQLVSEYESDPINNKISIETPIAKGIMGKKIGDTAQVNLAGKWVEFEILEINYAE